MCFSVASASYSRLERRVERVKWRKRCKACEAKSRERRQSENESWREIIQLEESKQVKSCFRIEFAIILHLHSCCLLRDARYVCRKLIITSRQCQVSCRMIFIPVLSFHQRKRALWRRAAFGTMMERATSEIGIKKDRSTGWGISWCQMAHVTVAIFPSIGRLHCNHGA